MESIKKISPNIYLIVSFILVTTAIGCLFLEKLNLAIIALIIGIISLVAWTFFGLFEET